MNTEAVAPFQLHRMIVAAINGDETTRLETINTVLASGNLAVIRRIVELKPLSDLEKELMLETAGKLTASQEISEKDFGFHMLVSCEIDPKEILSLLEKNKTFSRSALDHIQQMFGNNSPEAFLDYQYEVAEELLQSDRIPSRDRGCHIHITIASTPEEWHELADRLSDEENIWDLRQRVLERFLTDCKDEAALKLFVGRVVEYCMEKITTASIYEVHSVTSYMHWVITSLTRIGATDELNVKTSFFTEKFGWSLPWSLKTRITGDQPHRVSYYDDYLSYADDFGW
jgi:hypothetical protein